MSGESGFGRAKRLRKTDEISSVFRFKRSLSGPYLQLLWKPNGGTSPRLAVVVAKKIERSAVRRNYMKRVLREAFRLQQQNLGGRDMVVRARKAFDRRHAPAVREELIRHFTALAHGTSTGLAG